MGDSKNTKKNRFKYVGKELDRMYGIDMQDHGARWYDPITCRWNTLDCMSEKYFYLTSYSYCHNTPLCFVDLNGMDDYFDSKGYFLKHTSNGSSILVQVDDKYYNIRNINFRNTNDILKNVVCYYISLVDKNNFSLSVESNSTKNPNGAMLAYDTETDTYSIFINSDGKIHSCLCNLYNMRNSTYHEYLHRTNIITRGGGLGEVEAVILETSHDSWNMVSDEYIDGQADYSVKKLNDYIQEHPNDIATKQEMIERLNTAFIGLSGFAIDDKTNNIIRIKTLKEISITAK